MLSMCPCLPPKTELTSPFLCSALLCITPKERQTEVLGRIFDIFVMGRKRDSPSAASSLLRWLRRLPMKMKVFLGLTFAAVTLIILRLTLGSHIHKVYIISELCHAIGIIVLIYKLTTQRTCSGLSLKSQELTAIFLVTRFVWSVYIEQNIHTILDLVTLVSTLWVIYMIRFKLKSTYIKELDNLPMYYIVVPCAVLSALVHPHTNYFPIGRFFFAFSAYIEAVSVLPQLRLMQNAKMIEPFTGHYVFALGLARFLAWAYWLIKTYETGGAYFFFTGSGYFWTLGAVLAEIVQSFILIDFCYYYIRSYIKGEQLMSMPV
ncbi:ER lumen protein-retaining receptor erd-2.2-like [Punica granatum]|uniref:ER lumen protein-retaining receptor erd-2.2-like n=1 Tax=Punica granatum TaxID=22663 RepID=A0A6P8ELQ0_PUNGR|nr:ER lumen protein-retaining receptor erd-2.2-like [Punica granatum]